MSGKKIITNQDTKKIIDDFNALKIPILIGTDVVGEGVDTVGVDALILAGAGKAKSEIVQKIGRSLRLRDGKKYAIVVDFADRNVSTFERQSLIRKGIFAEYGTKIELI